ncbi:MAG: heavy metal translocating P-type ATPase [Pseudomonadota bacterium]
MTAPLAALVDPSPAVVTRIAVPGMRCAGCIAKIEKGMAELSGVITARVDFTAKQLRVTHLPELELPTIIGSLGRLGFDAHVLATPLTTVDDDAEQRRLLSALGVAAFAAMNIMLLSVSVWSGAAGGSRAMFHWLSAAIAIPTVIWSGRPFFVSAWAALRHGRTNMDVPISIGVTLATAMSLYETVTGGEHAWFDGAVMLLFFLLAGRVLDGMMRGRARQGALALMQASASGVSVLDAAGVGHWVRAEDIQPGAHMLVAAGERIAADGVLESSACRIDRSMLTGEATPVAMAAGDEVLAGMLNLDGPIIIVASRIGEDRAIAGLARAMQDAGQHRSAYVRIADRAARLYAPAVHTLAAASFIGWMIAGAGVHQSLLIAIAVLIITCPCALGLAVPVAQVVASGALMRAGILVKDGSALERLASASRVVFDKTGTVTLGRMVPQGLEALDAHQRAVALALAQSSTHPLSKGLATALRAMGVTPAALRGTSEIAGQGMQGYDGDSFVQLGRPADAAHGHASVALTIGDAPQVVITMADALRPDAAEAIQRLRTMGMPAMLLSGDNDAGVAPIAQELGLNAVSAARPEEKLALIQDMAAAGDAVLMVGDGLNDGPALAAAHASMAPSSASDVGQQAADLVFMGDSLIAVPRAVMAARRTQAVVRQNMALAIGYNIIAVPLAIAGLATPLIAAVAMSCSSLIVVGNSLRLIRATNGGAR